MRSAGNFHPEWGYLAPAPSFIRTVRMVLIATAVGATAGAGVVLSLVDRPADGDVAARTLARPVEAASSTLNAPQAAPVNAPAAIQNATQNHSSSPSPSIVRAADSTASESHVPATEQAPQSTTTLAETAAAIAGAPAEAADTPPLPPQKKVAKKHHVAPLYASRSAGFLGDSYGETGGLFMNGISAGSYREDRWGGYQDRDAAYYDR